MQRPPPPGRPLEVLLVFLRLGLSAFGGPIAHLGYFREAFVVRRRWLSERSYTDLVALCQFLPGPASSQVGIAIGLSRAGAAGALAAWCGFTLPSAIALILFALGLAQWGEALPAGLLQGLKIAAVAVVAQAVWGMGRSQCPDAPRIAIAAAAASAVLWWPAAWMQILVIALAAAIAPALRSPPTAERHQALAVPLGRATGAALLGLFFLLLAGLPLLAGVWPTRSMALFDSFYRAGSLVFGGGHVVLPLLQAEVVPNGWVDQERFLAGYGAAQAVPGPLFTFAAFLGASMNQAPTGWSGGLLALVAIFLPSFLLVAGALPFWEALRANRHCRAALAGVNAAVVGLLAAALVHPVGSSAIHGVGDLALALLALAALMRWRIPPWLVVLGCAGGGWLLAAVG